MCGEGECGDEKREEREKTGCGMRTKGSHEMR